MITLIDNVKIPTSIIPLVEFADDLYLMANKYMKNGMSIVGRAYRYFEGPYDQVYTKEAVYLKPLGAAYDTETPVVYGEGSQGSVYRATDTYLRYETMGKSKVVSNGTVVRDVATTYMPMETIYKGVSYDIVKVRGVAANTINLYTISTVDGTAAALATASVGYTNYKYMDEDTSFVYIWAFKENGKVNIIKFDKTAKTSTVITTVSSLNMETGPKASFYTKNIVRKPFKVGSKTYVPILYVNASNAVVLRVITYDSSVAGSDIATKVRYDDYTLTGTITLPTHNVNGFQYYFREDGVLVICTNIWGIATAMGATTIDQYGMYTLTVDHTAKTAEVKGFVQAANLVPLHYIFDGDDNVYAVTQYSYAKLEYDTLAKKYIKVSEVPTAHISIGLEARGYMNYIIQRGSEFPLLQATPTMVDIVECIPVSTAKVETKVYPVETGVKVRAKATTGELLSKVVTLSITNGPGVFTANSAKQIEVTTSATDYVTVPVSLTSPGEVIIQGKVSGALV